MASNSNDKKQKLAQHPPKSSPHVPKDVTNHGGGHGAGKQGPGVHPSLKPGLMK